MQNISVLLVTDLLFIYYSHIYLLSHIIYFLLLIYSHQQHEFIHTNSITTFSLLQYSFSFPLLFFYTLHILRESYYVFFQVLFCKTSAPIAI